MPATYEPIATTTLGSAASTITFSSIPSTYTDLKLVLVARDPGYAITPGFRFNSDTGTNYSATQLTGNGSTAYSSRYTNATKLDGAGGGSTTGQPSLHTFDVFSYAGSTNKTALYQYFNDKNGSGAIENFVGLWRNTSAINTITVIDSGGGNLGTGTTATLYGILKA